MAAVVTIARRAPTRRPGVIALLVAAPLVLSAACGSATISASQSVPVGDGPGLDPPSPTAAPVSSGVATAITPVGTVLTSDGYTLYRYAKDRAAPPRSTCTGGCATTWPPVVAADPPAGTGMDSALLGALDRADGTRQLTVDGWPVYRFARDTAPGDVKGQGANGGAWTAIGFDGKPVEQVPSAAPRPKP